MRSAILFFSLIALALPKDATRLQSRRIADGK